MDGRRGLMCRMMVSSSCLMMLLWRPAVIEAFQPMPAAPRIRQISLASSVASDGGAFRRNQTTMESTSSASSSEFTKQNPSQHRSKKKAKLSRPERKALERRRKADRRKHGNNKKPKYPLHSTAIDSLTSASTADDVMRAIKRAQNRHDGHDMRVIAQFLLHETDDMFAYGYKGSLLARLVVAALHTNHHTVAAEALAVRRTEYRASMLPLESAAIVRGLLRVHNVTDAIQVLEDELSLPLEGSVLTEAVHQDRLKHRALALASLASRHFFEGEPVMAVSACRQLTELGPIIRTANIEVGGTGGLDMPWARLLKGAAQCQSGIRDGSVVVVAEPAAAAPKPDGLSSSNANIPNKNEPVLPCNLVYAVLQAMTTFPTDDTEDDRVYEIVSNALVRRVVFVTGAVNLAGCPKADRGEAAFIGRSNVGKSSLVNMVTNRKSLAYTSKRPGKTQQFNFFAANDKPGREKEIRFGDVLPGEKDADAFYMVDLPGFGYAKVPDQLKREWADFMDDYFANRKSLRVLFHLIDGRHGPTEEDGQIMQRIADRLPARGAKYVIVLTKADKNVKGSGGQKRKGKVTETVMNSVRAAMKENGVGNAPVILTSAETKLGRDDMWRYLRLAAET